MKGFHEANYPEMLGVTPVCQVTDEEVWQLFLSPITRALLGPIQERSRPVVLDTLEGFFPGDNVSNINDHRIFGKHDRVRNHYVNTLYRTRNGALVIKRDGLKIETMAWFGDVDSGKAELIFKAGLRDRRFDGTLRANDCSLLDFPYDDPVYDRPLSPDLSSIELSIYAYMPGSRIADMVDDIEYQSFVRQPYAFRQDPEKFLRYFGMVWNTKRAPGQYATPIPDVSGSFLANCEIIARRYGYDFLEMAPSHYHVARWGLAKGYRIVDPCHARILEGYASGLKQIRDSGIPLSRTQQSWVCVVQSLPREHVPENLRLAPDLVWPQDNISNECLWLFKPVSQKAAGFTPEPILRLCSMDLHKDSIDKEQCA